MKILHIPTGGLFSDGIGTFIYSYLECMDLDKWEVTVLATNIPLLEDKAKFENLGIQVVVLERKKTAIIHYMCQLYKLIRANKYDIIHVHGSSSLMSIELSVAKIAGIPVRIAHSHNTTCDHRKLDKVLRPVFHKLYTQAWACGEGAGKWLFTNREYTIIHNARNIKRYQFSESKRQQFRKKLSLKDTTLALGHVGRFNVQKNHEFLVLLLENLVIQGLDVKLFLVGEGSTLSKIKNMVSEKSLEDRVFFLGHLNDMKSFVSAMDIMLLPSLYEGLPLVSVEWQLNGIQCILSDTITKECIYTKQVTSLPIGTPLYWGKAIRDFCPEDRLRQSIENQRLAREAGYDIELESVKLDTLYNKLIMAIKDRTRK
ncbi:glycosyltransferase family 1 protein [Streptococcus oralis]|uniref:glycosyltransferase family 1 protein n=1 Tax=Streptococcus oralis TaxID=1303 RepID=UPI0020016A7F|nr:glycosyltransferase family 1 protein [Streptococcus oralis]